ncbi:MAG: hypothetical protein PHP62_02350 [Candidatus Moranbacteria bacterium]|nr:hypothetical protein [Candidatus Moranbacteria bacterium]
MEKTTQNNNLLENLVALTYCPAHSSYPEVIRLQTNMPGLELNLEAGTWRYTRPGCRPNTQPPKKIGEYDYLAKDSSSGIIGIYDRTSDTHLTSIVRGWQTIRDAKNINWNDVD